MSTTDVKVKFTGDPSNLKAATAQVKSDIDEVTQRVKAQQAAMRETAGAIRGYVAAYAGIAAIKGELDFAGRIQDLSERFGESAENLQRLGAAAKPAGADLETIAISIGKVTVAAVAAVDGNEEMSAAFSALGINAAAFVNLPITEKVMQLAGGFAGAQGDGEKLNSAMKLLGKSGAELLPLLKQGPEALAASMKSAVVMTDDEIEKLDNVGDRITIAGTTLKTVFGEALVWVTDRIEEAQVTLSALIDGVLNLPSKMGAAFDKIKHGDFSGAASEMTQGFESGIIALRNKRKDREDALKAKAEARANGGGGAEYEGAEDSGGGKKSKEPAVNELPSETAYRLALAGGDPTDPTFKNGSVRRPGELRVMQRKAALDRAREDRRIARGAGGPGRFNNQGDVGAAEKLAISSLGPRSDLHTSPLSAENLSNEPGFWKHAKSADGSKDFIGPIRPNIEDGSKGAAAGSKDSKDDPMSKLSDDVAAIRKVTEDRLPKKSTGKG